MPSDPEADPAAERAPSTPASLHSLKADRDVSVGQLLLKAARLFNEAGVWQASQQLGLSGLRTAHTRVFPHIDLERGTRLTDLAAAMGMSKQGAAQLVAELVAMGALERRPDPDDGRARRIAFAARDPHPVRDGLAALGEVEQSLRDVLGADAMATLVGALRLVIESLETPKPPVAG